MVKSKYCFSTEVTYENLDASVDLATVLPEAEAKLVFEKLKPEVDKYAAMSDADKKLTIKAGGQC
jgi:hypothetical protein